MMMTWSWMADAVLAVLLTATLVMSVRLDRALRVVRRDRASFETLISNLGAATGSVKAGIQALRAEAERSAEQVERRSVEADKMATDLSFLVEAADRAGARLEQTLQSLARPDAGLFAEGASSMDGTSVGNSRRLKPAQASLDAAMNPRGNAKTAAATPRRRSRKVMPKATVAAGTTAPAADEQPEGVLPAPTVEFEGGHGLAHQAALDAELRARAGITTRRRTQRTENGTALIKLVG